MRTPIFIFLPLTLVILSSCDRDKTAPDVSITEPAYDGKDIQYGDVFIVQFEATDDREDGGLWRVELRAGDGATVKTAQVGLWEGTTTGSLVTGFSLNAESWPSDNMTLAVLADDAAGNRAADFRDFNYTAAADVPQTFAILTAAEDGSSSLQQVTADGESIGTWTELPDAHKMAYSDGVMALADASLATVHFVDWSTGEVVGAWEDNTSSGSTPLIRNLRSLGLQAGFVIAHAGGVVAIDPSSALLFERFSEAPWTPIDVQFDGSNCIVWEENAATGSQRLRSWDFITGATGPIIGLAGEAAGWGIVSDQDSGTEGNVFFLSETGLLTLCQTSDGSMNDMCGLLGEGAYEASPHGATGLGGQHALFSRGGFLCRQAVSPVTSGTLWPQTGELLGMRTSTNGSVQFILSSATGAEFWEWTEAEEAPMSILSGLPLNTMDVLLVNE